MIDREWQCSGGSRQPHSHQCRCCSAGASSSRASFRRHLRGVAGVACVPSARWCEARAAAREGGTEHNENCLAKWTGHLEQGCPTHSHLVNLRSSKRETFVRSPHTRARPDSCVHANELLPRAGCYYSISACHLRNFLHFRLFLFKN